MITVQKKKREKVKEEKKRYNITPSILAKLQVFDSSKKENICYVVFEEPISQLNEDQWIKDNLLM